MMNWLGDVSINSTSNNRSDQQTEAEMNSLVDAVFPLIPLPIIEAIPITELL